MSNLYIRHEIFRHESVRKFSMINVEHDEKYEIARYGFYADVELSSFICFSCQMVIHFSDVKTAIAAHILHRSKSIVCSFLLGLDVSIKDESRGLNFGLVCNMGSPQFNNNNYFSRRIPKKQFDEIMEKYSLENPAIVKFTQRRQQKLLNSQHVPMYLPPVKNSNIGFNCEVFFTSMKSEQHRLDTYNVKKMPFPFDENLANYLASNGFFFTLLNTTVQCAFCRIVIGNISPGIIISVPHRIMTYYCGFLAGKDVGNIPKADNTIMVNPTLKADIQCKICLINEINVVYECGHVIMCSECAFKPEIKFCPTCRASLVNRRRIYIS